MPPFALFYSWRAHPQPQLQSYLGVGRAIPCHSRPQKTSRKSLHKGMFELETCEEEKDGSCSSLLQDQAQVSVQVWVAAGPCNRETCYRETLISYVQMRDQMLPVYSQREGQWVFHQVSWSGVWAGFSGKSQEKSQDISGDCNTGEPRPLSCNGARKWGEEI